MIKNRVVARLLTALTALAVTGLSLFFKVYLDLSRELTLLLFIGTSLFLYIFLFTGGWEAPDEREEYHAQYNSNVIDVEAKEVKKSSLEQKNQEDKNV
jgi:hypothetical protein